MTVENPALYAKIYAAHKIIQRPMFQIGIDAGIELDASQVPQ